MWLLYELGIIVARSFTPAPEKDGDGTVVPSSGSDKH